MDQKQQLSLLYQELLNTKFAFIGKGEHHLQNIYGQVKKQFPELCNDDVLCIENCTNGTNNPEWQHRVRAALQNLKSANGKISKGSRHGYWVIQ